MLRKTLLILFFLVSFSNVSLAEENYFNGTWVISESMSIDATKESGDYSQFANFISFLVEGKMTITIIGESANVYASTGINHTSLGVVNGKKYTIIETDPRKSDMELVYDGGNLMWSHGGLRAVFIKEQG